MQSARRLIARLKILLNMLSDFMKKTRKIFRVFSLALKIIFGIVAVAIIILIIDFFARDNAWDTVVTEIHKGCYIECLDDNMQSVYYYPDGDETGERKYIVDEWEAVLKYASDGKEIVAFQCIYNLSEDDEENKFVIYNTTNKEKAVFDTQGALTEFCEKEKIILSEWQSVHC